MDIFGSLHSRTPRKRLVMFDAVQAKSYDMEQAVISSEGCGLGDVREWTNGSSNLLGSINPETPCERPTPYRQFLRREALCSQYRGLGP